MLRKSLIRAIAASSPILRDPDRRPPRAVRDEALKPEIQRVWDENFRVYGAHKVWKQLNREQRSVARCTVERLMRALGLRGVVRGRRVKTTIPEELADRGQDRVNRTFTVSRPNGLWVADLTYVATWRAYRADRAADAVLVLTLESGPTVAPRRCVHEITSTRPAAASSGNRIRCPATFNRGDRRRAVSPAGRGQRSGAADRPVRNTGLSFPQPPRRWGVVAYTAPGRLSGQRTISEGWSDNLTMSRRLSVDLTVFPPPYT